MSSVKGASVCESRRTELLCQQSSFFHVLTATYVKLLPVAWVLDFGSLRAWLGIDRLASHSSYLEWWGEQRLKVCMAATRVHFVKDNGSCNSKFLVKRCMLKFVHA